MGYRNKRKNYRKRPGLSRRKSGLGKSTMINVRQPVHYFKRTVRLTDFSCDTGFNSLTYKFKLSDLPNYTEFTSLFDEYKILGVALRFIPPVNSGPTLDATSTVYLVNGSIMTIVDYNTDNGTALSENQMYEYANMKITRGTQIHSRYIRPHVAYVQGETEVPFDTSKRVQWINTQYPDVRHLGITVGSIPPLDVLGNTPMFRQAFQVICTYYVAMRTCK